MAGSESDSSDRPKLFHELSGRGKAVRIGIIAFLVLHLASLLVGGAIPPIRKFFQPVLGFYGEGLRMSNAWGMFGKPPTSTHVVIEAVGYDGRTVALSTTDMHKETLFERIRDGRMRKFQGKFSETGDKNKWGPYFLDYYCRLAKQQMGRVKQVDAREFLHETKDDDDVVTRKESTQVVFSRRCDEVIRVLAPISPKGAPGKPEQGDM